MVTVGTPGMWLGFMALILGLLALDLGVFHRKDKELGFKEAAVWSGIWIGLALLFNVGIWYWFGDQLALEFLTGYLIEKSLSVDNIFVFLVLFSAFAVPSIYQHRVLFWGIIGALIMRAVLVLVGGALLASFHWLVYIFGAGLVFTGIKLLLRKDDEIHPERNPLFRLFRRLIPSTPEYHGNRFLVKEAGKWLATPLLLVLVSVEITDLVFAVDSIPAIFAITSDPFIVFTSNIFAILGLRSLYFMLSGALEKLHYLKVGLALVLTFVGAKLVLVDVFKVPTWASLSVVTVLIGGSVIASLWWPKKEKLPSLTPRAGGSQA